MMMRGATWNPLIRIMFAITGANAVSSPSPPRFDRLLRREVDAPVPSLSSSALEVDSGLEAQRSVVPNCVTSYPFWHNGLNSTSSPDPNNDCNSEVGSNCLQGYWTCVGFLSMKWCYIDDDGEGHFNTTFNDRKGNTDPESFCCECGGGVPTPSPPATKTSIAGKPKAKSTGKQKANIQIYNAGGAKAKSTTGAYSNSGNPSACPSSGNASVSSSCHNSTSNSTHSTVGTKEAQSTGTNSQTTTVVKVAPGPAPAVQHAQAVSAMPREYQSEVMDVKTMTCGETLFAPDGDCPAACPYFAEEVKRPCSFKCVAASSCGNASLGLDPNEHISDDAMKLCRVCNVGGCVRCQDDYTCNECGPGYNMQNGRCFSKYWYVLPTICFVIFLIIVFLLAWYVQLRNRPTVNEEGVQEGLAYRSRLKLHMPHWMAKGESNCLDDEDEEKPPQWKLWPLSTSLHNANVAGPGLNLHMDFHAVLIIWAAVMLVGWTCYAFETDPELLLNGITKAEEQNAAELCAVNIRGKRTQTALMLTKVQFLIGAYVFTLIGCVAYAVFHKHKYVDLDESSTSMRDFAAMLRGLPTTQGTEKLEEQVAQIVREATGQNVVGVSVAWIFSEKSESVKEQLEKEMVAFRMNERKSGFLSAQQQEQQLQQEQKEQEEEGTEETAEGAAADGAAAEAALLVKPPRIFQAVDRLVWLAKADVGVKVLEMAQEPEEQQGTDAAEDDTDPTELVEQLLSSETAFVVFETEEARDAAVQVSKEANGSLEFKGSSFTLEPAPNEPDTVCWEHFHIQDREIVSRTCKGCFLVFLCSLLWCAAFYLPYAYYYSSYAYVKNAQPSAMGEMAFTGLVVIGNLTMYAVCNAIAYSVGFRFSCDAEAFYIVTYTFSVLVNVVVDLILEGWMTHAALVATDAHTADGKAIADITDFQELFESYPMQRAMGHRLFYYCFPGTFFLPFVLEPLATIFLPYHVMRTLLSKYPGIRGRNAEKAMDFFAPMDLSRYGDLALNVCLVNLICLFPSGEMLKLFLAFVLSHLFIYLYDQYRVLRCVPGFCFAGDSCDNVCQAMLTIPCGILAICVLIKGNSLLDENRLRDTTLAAACACCFILHVIIHIALVRWCVPIFTKQGKAQTQISYAERAPDIPCTWFSANPVHCLRSKHIYGDEPSCHYYHRGGEHTLRANPKIGCYYEDKKKAVCDEEYRC